MIVPKQETYYILTARELDELIQHHFNKPYFECVAYYEWSNMQEHTGTVFISNLNGSELEQESIQEFINHPNIPRYPVHWSILLSELARRGKVPEGNYLIEVFW